jgi:UDP-N-acetyl-D-mannosaminuronic acid dehydrogenase
MWTPKHVVVVGGCGHVGLPLGLLFASRGVSVTLLDIDKGKVEKVNRGEMPFMEQGAPELLRTVVGKGLEATLDDACLARADAAIAVVGTPVDKYLNPTLRNLCRSVDDLLNRLPEDALLVLRSTVYPGVTKIVYDRVRALGQKGEQLRNWRACPRLSRRLSRKRWGGPATFFLYSRQILLS